MRSKIARTSVITLLLMLALVASVRYGLGLRPVEAQTAPDQAAKPATLQGEAALTQLKKEGQYESLQAAMQQARYTVSHAMSTPLQRAAWHAPNPAHGYDGYVTEDGVSIAVGKSAYVSLTLRGLGYGDALHYVNGGTVSGAAQTISLARDGEWQALREWYVNSASGLEQGFTLDAPPSGGKRGGLKLRLAFEVSPDWRAVASADGQRVTLLGAEGTAVEYGKLVVWDAHGSPVAASLQVADERVLIEVDDQQAVYPLTIDPTFALQQKVLAADGAGNGLFGMSVAISGATAVIGTQRSAYVFVRTGATWVQQAKLVALDGAAGDAFGWSVGISGDTVAVGAFQADVNGKANQGSAYVFTRTGTLWTQQQKLTAGDGAAEDWFGNRVAVSGDMLIVGAINVDAPGAATTNNQGAAYVFTRTGTLWTQQQKLTAADGAAGDQFGTSVAINTETVVVGSPFDAIGANGNQGSAYVFTRSGTTWTQQQKITATDGAAGEIFGYSVAISGDTLVTGAPWRGIFDKGSAFVFKRSGTVWTQQQELTASDGAQDDSFGWSVAISGNTVVVSPLHFSGVEANLNPGAAYVFTHSGTTWTQQQKLSAGDGAAGDEFGRSVAISAETVLVGADLDDVGVNANQGSAYFYSLSDGPSVPQAQLLAGGGAANDQFGTSVAISGNVAVIGAPKDDVGANVDQGSAYVFIRNGTTWNQLAQLVAPDGAAADQFGSSVAISGDTVVVGARFDNVGAKLDQGSVYVFTPGGISYTQQAQLLAADGAAEDWFGSSVAISGDTIVVGAAFDDVGTNIDRGSAYTFIRSGTTWTQQQQLTAAGGTGDQGFGFSVAISGDTVIVGAPYDNVGTKLAQGTAYVFTRSGTTWTQQAQLLSADGAEGDNFGISVAVSGDTAVVGVFSDNVGANTTQGSAQVFTRKGTAWTLQQQLFAADGAASDSFGKSVAISGDTLVVGAYGDQIGTNTFQGSAYVFVRSGTAWTQQKLVATGGAAVDLFGSSVAISGDTVIVGAPFDDIGTSADQGSASVFVPCRYDLTPASQTFPATAGSGFFNIVCTGSCNWTAAPLAPWLSLTSSATGSGNGTISFNVAANPGLPRTSSISVSGSNFIVSQAGNCPALTLSPAVFPGALVSVPYSQTLTASGGSAPYTFQLVYASLLPPGLTLSAAGVISGVPPAGSQGTYAVTIAAVDANGCVGTRFYSFSVATCAVSSLTPNSASVSSTGGSGTFAVTAPGCGWTALPQSPWLSVTSNGTGTGNAVVGYSFRPNPGAARTGFITVNNQVFTVNQAVGDPNGDLDGDGIPNGVEFTEGTDPEYKDNDIFINTQLGNRLFVMQQYRDFLGREGDPGGITNWVNALNANTLTRAQVINAFFNSAEFQNTVAPIVRLYFAYFLRIPDYAGLQNWTNAYRGGMSLDTISGAFAGSAEFIQRYGSLNNTQFVTLVYNNVLGRAPDAGGLANWVNALNGGMSRGTMMLNFSESAEYRPLIANKVYVTMMYIGMLRRSPEQAGFDNWVAYLNGGNSGLALINGFINAQEYRNRFLPALDLN